MDQNTPQLAGQPAEFSFTIEVKRAETGLIETFDMVGTVINESEEVENVSNT